MTWTTETIAELTRLVNAGHTSNEVERLMPGFGRNSIISKARRLNLRWHTPPIGGRDRVSITPEKRRQIKELLKGGMSSIRVAAMTSVSPSTVKTIKSGRTPPPRAVTIPPLQTQETSMIVADVRQAAFRVVEGPPVRVASNVVALPGTGVRTCQWISGDSRPWSMCGERVAWLGCSWCSIHARRVWARHPLIADAAD